MPKLLQAAFGSVRLYAVDVDTDVGRALIVHTPAQGDDYVVQDRGRRLERCRLEVLFCDVPGERDDHHKRYRQFKALRDEGKAQIFVHPFHGAYRARIGDCREAVSAENDSIRVSVEFVPAEPPKESVNPAGVAVVPLAGPEAVAVEVALTNTELTSQGLTSAAPSSAQTTVESWSEIDLDEDSRKVYVEATSTIETIDAEISRLQMATDIKRWPLYVRFVLLRDKVLAAAEAAAGPVAQVFELAVVAPTPLRALCARTYGADQADAKAREVRQMNNLRDPSLVPAGTKLKMPVPEARS